MENITVPVPSGTKVTVTQEIDNKGNETITVVSHFPEKIFIYSWICQTQTQEKPLLDKAADTLNDVKDYLGQKITDAKDALWDTEKKAEAEAKHAKIDAEYNMNKAAVNTAKFVEKKADDLKVGAGEFKKDVQREGLF